MTDYLPVMPKDQAAREACARALQADPAARCRCGPVDTKTRHQGCYARHQRACRITHDADAKCNCAPAYWGTAYDAATRRQKRTAMLRTAAAAKSARASLQAELAARAVPGDDDDVVEMIRFADAVDRFLKAALKGTARNKKGKKYTPDAYANLEGSLRVHATPELGPKYVTEIRPRHVQKLVDELQEKAPLTPGGRPREGETLSGSRIRSVVNSIRALYRWLRPRGLAEFDPAADVLLPAMESEERDRIATPAEMAGLLDAIVTAPAAEDSSDAARRRHAQGQLGDAAFFAVAYFAGPRMEAIRRLELADLDLSLGVLYVGENVEHGRKTDAAKIGLPLCAYLRAFLIRYLASRADLIAAGIVTIGRRSRLRVVGDDGVAAPVVGDLTLKPGVRAPLIPGRQRGGLQERREAVAELHGQGRSLRSIAGTLGTSLGAVQRDLAAGVDSSRGGMMAMSALQKRADDVWSTAGLKRITPQECRHSWASVLDAAHVRPVIASILMCHTVTHVPDDGGAPITRQRYTHALPGALDEAIKLVDTYIHDDLKQKEAKAQ